MQTERCT